MSVVRTAVRISLSMFVYLRICSYLRFSGDDGTVELRSALTDFAAAFPQAVRPDRKSPEDGLYPNYACLSCIVYATSVQCLREIIKFSEWIESNY